MQRELQPELTPILFVDDEPLARRAFARAMRARGFDVDCAGDAARAVEHASERSYALIACDLNMPLVNGLRAIEQLSALQPDAAYMLVTGVTELCLPRSPDADRVSSVVFKPWDADALAQSIWRGIELRRERSLGVGEPPSDAASGTLGSVLIVVNDPLDPEFMLRSLVAAGLPNYQLIQSERLSDALGVAMARDLQLIVTELALPDARGVDAVRALRDAAPGTPLVVIGGQPDEVLALQTLRAGAQDYLARDQLTAETVSRALRFAIERVRSEEAPSRTRSVAPAERRHFEDAVTRSISRARREGDRVAVAYLSLQRDTDDAAAEPLSASLASRVTERIRGALREYDTLAYLGHNRFGLILPAMQAGDRADVPARRLVDQLSAPFVMQDVSIRLAVTLGIGVFPDDADTAEELCRCADVAGCRAQALGSGSCEFFDEGCQESSRARRQLELELDRALRDWQFLLRYRPQHALAGGQVVAAEGVVSWQRDDGQLWDPERYFAALEEHDLSSRLTGWMLREACYQGRAWQERHPGLVTVLDLSPRQLQDPDLLDKLTLALEQSRLPPELLELEVAEASVELARVQQVLEGIAALGVRLTIDDFGHRLSLARLSELPIGAIKIGPSLADLAGTDRRGAALIRAAAHLSRDLSIDLSAMGVDEPCQLDFLQQVGCQRAQGELYGPARTAEATWLSAP
jgi:EAL domain-containing protein (putative c-di-GMP-specific phosphodiesterase class I)/DNA-binding response OmpR family regulator